MVGAVWGSWARTDYELYILKITKKYQKLPKSTRTRIAEMDGGGCLGELG